MRGLGWLIIAILIALGIWYFGFYNDQYEAPENRDETAEIEESIEDLIDTDFEITREDDRDEYYFSPSSTFSMLSDGEDDLEWDCDNEDVIVESTSTPSESNGLRVFNFEARNPGTCRLEIGDWVTTVNVLEDTKG